MDANCAIADFPATNNNSALFKHKKRIKGETAAGSRKDVEIIVSLNI